MTIDNPFPQSLLNIAEGQIANTAQKAKELQAQAEEAASIQKLWEDITLFMRRGWLLHLLDVIDKQDTLLKKMKADNHPTIGSFVDSVLNFN